MAERLYTIGPQISTRGNVAGVLTDLYEIHYQGPNGITGYIRVPVAQADPAAVDALIRQRLEQQLSIAALGAE